MLELWSFAPGLIGLGLTVLGALGYLVSRRLEAFRNPSIVISVVGCLILAGAAVTSWI